MANCLHGCGAVADCSEPKQFIREENTYRPAEFGVWKYVPQCMTCSRCGAARRDVRNGATLVTRDQANALKAKCELEQKARIERARLDYEKKQRDENEQWWADYNAYLKTPEWEKRRRAVLARDPTCQGCGKRPATQAHHMSYRNRGNEFLFELVGICADCHDRFHKRGRYFEAEGGAA